MNPVGIMQGRLSVTRGDGVQAFPSANWPTEFSDAAAAGFDQIEWLVTADAYSENPLFSDSGTERISRLIAATGTRVTTLCADFLITQPLVRVNDDERTASVAKLLDVIRRSRRIGTEVIVVPILELGEVRNHEESALVAKVLEPVAREAAAHGQRVALESQLPAVDLLRLVERFGNSSIGACYDLGNAAAAGFDCASDIQHLSGTVYAVHVKDRTLGGGSVPLGEGHVHFSEAFAALASIGYGGALILETPVGGDPIDSARRHRAFVARNAAPLAAIGE